MIVLARQAVVGEQIVGADQHHIDAFDRHDLVGVLDRLAALELHDHHGCGIDSRIGLGRRKGAILQMREVAGVGAVAERRILRSLDVLARFGGRLHMRRDDAERAGIENALHVADAGHADEWRDADFERGDTDLAHAFQRKARMLHVHIEAVEARGFGDPRDLDAADEPHRHRGHDLVAGELFLHMVAQDIADLCRF